MPLTTNPLRRDCRIFFCLNANGLVGWFTQRFTILYHAVFSHVDHGVITFKIPIDIANIVKVVMNSSISCDLPADQDPSPGERVIASVDPVYVLPLPTDRRRYIPVFPARPCAALLADYRSNRATRLVTFLF